MAIELHIGPEIVRSYKRLAYTPWHALAEFVDNSTQSYFTNRDLLDHAHRSQGEEEMLTVSISYSGSGTGEIAILDDAMGMSEAELSNALRIGQEPLDKSGRSEFGLGMKTAACWFGNEWMVTTKRLGDTKGNKIVFNVEKVASSEFDMGHEQFDASPEEHYTILQIRDLNKKLAPRTINYTKLFLASMYRVDIRDGRLALFWGGEPLRWRSPVETNNVHEQNGRRYYREFSFDIDDKAVTGWLAVMERGSRSNAGFSIIRRGRVIKGWPDSWRPQAIFGQYEGSNDLVNQRLIGEVNLDDFGVTHTKDDILWAENEQEEVEHRLSEEAKEYVDVARSFRRRGVRGDKPSPIMISRAVGMMTEEIYSDEIEELINRDGSTPVAALKGATGPMLEAVRSGEPEISRSFNSLELNIFVSNQLSPRDPYLGVEHNLDGVLNIIVNLSHPHIRDLQGSVGVLNHIKSCAYDGLAQWRARASWDTEDPNVISIIKDRLLRVGARVTGDS